MEYLFVDVLLAVVQAFYAVHFVGGFLNLLRYFSIHRRCQIRIQSRPLLGFEFLNVDILCLMKAICCFRGVLVVVVRLFGKTIPRIPKTHLLNRFIPQIEVIFISFCDL